jgi:hypothetical protein
MATLTTLSTAIHALEAFCPGCPSPDEVTAFLDTLGLTLGFTMGAVPAHDRNVAPLPAQYHYERDDVMYNQKSIPFAPFGETASRAGSAVEHNGQGSPLRSDERAPTPRSPLARP